MMDDKQYKLEESMSANDGEKRNSRISMNNAPLDHDDIDSVKARRNFKVIVGNKQTVNKKGTKNIRRNKTAGENRNYRHYTQGGEGSFTSFLYIIWSRIKSFIYSLKVKLKQ